MKFICEQCASPCIIMSLCINSTPATPTRCPYDGEKIVWKPILEVSE